MNFPLHISVFYILLTVIARSYAGAAVTVSGTEIRFLLDEETTLRQKLESRVQALKQRAAHMNSTITPCDCSAGTQAKNFTPQISFTGTQQQSLSSLGPSSFFEFANDLVNIGQPYNTRYSRFIAPVSGLYGFSLATYLNPSYWVAMELVADYKSILRVKHGHNSDSRYNRQVNMGTNFVIVNMTQGAEVWPRYVTGSGRLQGEGITTFSGYLIQEML